MPSPSESSPAPTRKSVAENVKETLESIVVAFILAFVFRAFIVEAFVIPTGSMAPTLYGEQLTNTCSTCGYEYALGIPSTRMPPYPVRLRCPNCDTLVDEFKPAQIARPSSGDRILVHKWPFDVGGELLGPKRWDVTVFKDPRDGTTNFIKRLVGLPGEALEIIDGDVYTVPIAKLKPELLAALEALRKDVYLERTTSQQKHREEFIKRYEEVNRQILPLLRIERKLPANPRAQHSLWFSVYDHDLLPNYDNLRSPKPDSRVGWEAVTPAAAKAWNARQREITCNAEGDEPVAIQFVGKPIEDFYAYNNDGVMDRTGQRQLVGDLRLRFTWFPDAGDGGISLRMNRDEDVFTAEVRADGTASVEAYQPESDLPGHRQSIGQKKLEPFGSGRAVEIEFINLDYRVTLVVDGQEVVTSTPEQYSPRLTKLTRHVDDALREVTGWTEVRPSEVQIAARRLQCRLRHVALERDVYYRSQKQSESTDEIVNPYYLWPGWGTAGFPIVLRSGREVDGRRYEAEYFMLGDNSPASKDSRLWWEIGPHLRHLDGEYQVGTVPQDQLIGKAFFVYWPGGYRPAWAGGIGLIPNFGQMRWIR